MFIFIVWRDAVEYWIGKLGYYTAGNRRGKCKFHSAIVFPRKKQKCFIHRSSKLMEKSTPTRTHASVGVSGAEPAAVGGEILGKAQNSRRIVHFLFKCCAVLWPPTGGPSDAPFSSLKEEEQNGATIRKRGGGSYRPAECIQSQQQQQATGNSSSLI